ncbi:alpha/beta hydrolase [Pendulispora rubella]|uniref:Alpha/beta hydrolase n=1 Tax=Pendulispora rubella TaxID=2741070 RepID=A0ABZ2KSC4_9BACT
MVALNDRLAAQTFGTHEQVVLFVHGGARPELTWSRQAPLADRWRLVIPWRRCFDPSPPGPRQDWEVDARDLREILPQGAHVVAHSYGGVGAAVAVAREPHGVSSLTLIEPPLWFVAEHDPEVARLVRIARTAGDPNADPELRKRFLQLAGLPELHPDTAQLERLARDLRDPAEARPDLDAIRTAGMPTAIVSGGHSVGLERLCDALGEGLGAARVVLPGAGHAVQRTPEFNGWLASFLEKATPAASPFRD